MPSALFARRRAWSIFNSFEFFSVVQASFSHSLDWRIDCRIFICSVDTCLGPGAFESSAGRLYHRLLDKYVFGPKSPLLQFSGLTLCLWCILDGDLIHHLSEASPLRPVVLQSHQYLRYFYARGLLRKAYGLSPDALYYYNLATFGFQTPTLLTATTQFLIFINKH